MKKPLLMFFISAGALFFSKAVTVYDPASGMIYCKTTSKKVNQYEYLFLMLRCVDIKNNMFYKLGRLPSRSELIKQSIHFLRQEGTCTALQLIKDIKNGYVYYPDGSVAYKIFYSLRD